MYRKRFIVLLSFLIIAIIGSGYGLFVFEGGNSSSNINANHQLDDIRDNYIFKDGNDDEIMTVQRYNVYFFSQSDFDPSIKDSQGNYSNFYNHNNEGLDVNLGYFGKPEDNSLLKVLKNVSEISVDDLFHVIGEPTTDCVDYINLDNDKPELGGWPLYFNGWALEWHVDNYYGLYTDTYGFRRVRGNYPHPEGGNGVRIMRFGTTIANYLNQTLTIEEQKEIIHQNGTSVPDLFLFPIYTSGKDYVNQYSKDPAKQPNNPIRIRYGQANNNKEAKDVFMNRGRIINEYFARYNEELKAAGKTSVDIKAVYHKYAININGCKSLTFNYADKLNLWRYWYPIGKHTDNLDLGDEFASRDFLKEDIELEQKGEKKGRTHLSRNGEGAGIYAMYAFRKENADFTGDELLKINYFCDNKMGMDRFYCFTSNKINVDNVYTEQIYFVIERFFEPRLLGGPTESYDYNSQACKDYSFTRMVNDTSLFALRNVKLNADTTFNYGDYSLSSALFSVKLESVAGHISSKEIGSYDLDENGKPIKDHPSVVFANTGLTKKEDYNITNYLTDVVVDDKSETPKPDTILTNYVKSKGKTINTANDITDNNDLKEDILDSFIINPKIEDPTEGTLEKNLGYGIYNIALKINYKDKEETTGQREFGPYIPNHIDVYVRRVTNIYTLIYDGEVPETEKLVNGFIKPNLVETETEKINYAFSARNVFLDTYLESADQFTASTNFVNSASDEFKKAFKEVSGEDLTAEKSYKLVDIVKAYDLIGKEVYDRVTKFILSEHSLKNTKFRIEKNYIFQVRNKTTAII